ncbi:MAG: hypothetical protein ACXVZ1_02040 [Gaiellaceae bacterium]
MAVVHVPSLRPSTLLVLILFGIAVLVLFGPLRGAPERRVAASWARTPGVLNPVVQQESISWTICRSGWTREIRPPVSYTTQLKREQMLEYGFGGELPDYQEDHLISLEIGGHPTDRRNLWPEPIEQARSDDGVENELHRLVCDGEISLAEAQRRESALKH